MKSYHEIEDLLSDKSFKDWVLKGDVIQQAFWEKWQAANPDKVEMLKHARTILLDLDRDGSDWNVKRQDLLFSKIRERINSKGRSHSMPIYRGYRSKAETWTKAAIFTFLLLASFMAFFSMDFSRQTEQPGSEEKEVWITKCNPRGQKSSIPLPDGSTVILNSASEIRYNSNFGQDQRDLFLNGEAFFEVAPDSLLPFRVFSGELVTMALGTSFNINAYNEGKEKVQLATGKVKVFKEKQSYQSCYLTPGEEVVVGTDSKLSKRKFDLHKAFLWKQGTLLFEQTPFSEVVLTLERWYAVEIEVRNRPSHEKKISGQFKDIYLSDLFESLGYAYGFDYQIKNKAVIINFTQTDDP